MLVVSHGGFPPRRGVSRTPSVAIGSALSLLSTASWLSTGSLLSARSRWSVLSWRSRHGFRATTAHAVSATQPSSPGPCVLRARLPMEAEPFGWPGTLS
nr:hypothetical protein [Streptomyces griseus]